MTRSWIWFTHFVAVCLGQFLNLPVSSVPQLSHLWDADNNTIFSVELLWRLNWVFYLEHKEQYLAHSKCSMLASVIFTPIIRRKSCQRSKEIQWQRAWALEPDRTQFKFWIHHVSVMRLWAKLLYSTFLSLHFPICLGSIITAPTLSEE